MPKIKPNPNFEESTKKSMVRQICMEMGKWLYGLMGRNVTEDEIRTMDNNGALDNKINEFAKKVVKDNQRASRDRSN